MTDLSDSGTERPACFEIVPTARAVSGADKNVAHFAASQSLQTALQGGYETPGVREPSSILHQGRTWSDLLFTMSNSTRLAGRTWVGRGFFITSGRAKRVAASARRSVQNFGGNNQESGAGVLGNQSLSRNGCRTQTAGNQHARSLSERRGPTIGSPPPIWWSQTGSNRRPPACKAGALPTELWPLRGSVISYQSSEAAAGKGHLITDS